MNTTESTSNHTAYLSGVSEWCSNCHGPSYHEGPTVDGFEHPSDRSLGGRISATYNAYNGDTDPVGGSVATAYLAQVPFEDAGSEISSTRGAAPSSRVMCLTCHRAHGSSAPSAGRWDFNVALLADDGVPFPVRIRCPTPSRTRDRGVSARSVIESDPGLSGSSGG